jgi:hypothetical protein
MGMPKMPRVSGRIVVAMVVAMAVAFAVTGFVLQGGALTGGLTAGLQKSGYSAGPSSNIMGAASSTDAGTSPAATSLQAGSSATIDRLVVFTGSVSLNVTNSSLTFQEVQNVAELDGGYVSDSSVGPEDGYGPQIVATAVVRVPADNFAQAMADLQKLGQVISAQTSSQDVTDNYVDLNASLTSYQKLLAQYQGFMNLTTNVNDALAVQAKIDSVQQTIDSLTAQIQEMSKEVNLATITVTITENFQEAPPAPKKDMVSDATGFAWGFALTEARGAVFLTVGLSPLWVWLVPLLVVTRMLHTRRAGSRAGASKVEAES